jgi:hypothetical protein
MTILPSRSTNGTWNYVRNTHVIASIMVKERKKYIYWPLYSLLFLQKKQAYILSKANYASNSNWYNNML